MASSSTRPVQSPRTRTTLLEILGLQVIRGQQASSALKYSLVRLSSADNEDVTERVIEGTMEMYEQHKRNQEEVSKSFEAAIATMEARVKDDADWEKALIEAGIGRGSSRRLPTNI